MTRAMPLTNGKKFCTFGNSTGSKSSWKPATACLISAGTRGGGSLLAFFNASFLLVGAAISNCSGCASAVIWQTIHTLTQSCWCCLFGSPQKPCVPIHFQEHAQMLRIHLSCDFLKLGEPAVAHRTDLQAPCTSKKVSKRFSRKQCGNYFSSNNVHIVCMAHLVYVFEESRNQLH